MSALKKTSFPNIYEKVPKNYIARFKHLGKRYSDKNFTKLYGCTTGKQASDKLYEVKSMLSQGLNPFKKDVKLSLNDYFDLYIEQIKGKDYEIKKTYYNKHIKPLIGKISISDLTEDHVNKILISKTLRDLAPRTKFTTKMILDPIFKKAIKDGRLLINPLEDIKFSKKSIKKKLHSRIVDSDVTVANILYNDIMALDNLEIKACLLIALMTARRRGEILQLHWSDIIEDKVYVRSATTKTNIDEEYPLPIEVVDIIRKLQKDQSNENIFSLKEDRPTRVFTRLIEKSSIKFTKGEKITLHDTRHLFISIMAAKDFNIQLLDQCISHSQGNTILDTYLSISYVKKKEVFEAYWNIIRKP